ncbi:MAG: hypothetical protein WBH64_04795, partial [Propionicimonas sp.]
MRHMPISPVFGLMHGIGCLLFLAAIAVVIWMIIKKKKGQWPPQHHHPGHVPPPPEATASNAFQILDERLARGEIEVDDYLSRRAALSGDRPNGAEYRPDPAPQPPHPEEGAGI